MPREKFGVGDNTAIGIDEVVSPLREFTFLTDRFNKATAQTSVTVFVAPYRLQIISVIPIVTVAFASNELVVTLGVTGEVSSLASTTIAADAAVGVMTEATLGASPVVAAGTAIVANYSASVGAGAFMFQVNCKRI